MRYINGLVILSIILFSNNIFSDEKPITNATPETTNPKCVSGCIDVVASVYDFSYLPITDEPIFGKKNCGKYNLESKINKPFYLKKPLPKFNAFKIFSKDSRISDVHYKTNKKDKRQALDCMFFLSEVYQSRLESEDKKLNNKSVIIRNQKNNEEKSKPEAIKTGLAELETKKEPIIFSWKNTIFLKYNHKQEKRLFWIPVQPNEQQKKNLKKYLANSAKAIVNSLTTKPKDLHDKNTEFAIGYLHTWVRLYFSKDKENNIKQHIVSSRKFTVQDAVINQ